MVQVRQRTAHEQAVRVLLQALVLCLGKAEYRLDDQEQMLDLGRHARLCPVCRTLDFIDEPFATIATIRYVQGVRCAFADDIPLPLIGRVTPYPCLLAMQQVGQAGRIVHIGGRRHHRMNDLGPAVHADMRLHAEVPLSALLRLVHVGVTHAVSVLGRGRCTDDRSIDDSACTTSIPWVRKYACTCRKSFLPSVCRSNR